MRTATRKPRTRFIYIGIIRLKNKFLTSKSPLVDYVRPQTKIMFSCPFRECLPSVEFSKHFIFHFTGSESTTSTMSSYYSARSEFRDSVETVCTVKPEVNLVCKNYLHTINEVLNTAPVYDLEFAFTIFRFIWAWIEQAQACQKQLRVLATCTAALLEPLDKHYRRGQLTKEFALNHIQDLNRFISMFLSVSCHQ